MKQGAAKGKTLFEKFKSAKLVGKLGGILGKLQLKAPIHLIDSLITYAIGVVAGMQDMAQVRVCVFPRLCQCVCVHCLSSQATDRKHWFGFYSAVSQPAKLVYQGVLFAGGCFQ